MCVIVFRHNPLISTPQVSRYTYLIIYNAYPTPGATRSHCRRQPSAAKPARCQAGHGSPPATKKSLTKPPPKAHSGLTAVPNGLFRSLKQPVWPPQTVRFAVQNGRYRNTLSARQLHKQGDKVKQSYKNGLAKVFVARSLTAPGISKLLARKSNNHIGFHDKIINFAFVESLIQPLPTY